MDYQSYLSHNVAVNLKRIRTSKGMSLDVLSEQTGVSKSMLAQIEKDHKRIKNRIPRIN